MLRRNRPQTFNVLQSLHSIPAHFADTLRRNSEPDMAYQRPQPTINSNLQHVSHSAQAASHPHHHAQHQSGHHQQQHQQQHPQLANVAGQLTSEASGYASDSALYYDMTTGQAKPHGKSGLALPAQKAVSKRRLAAGKAKAAMGMMGMPMQQMGYGMMPGMMYPGMDEGRGCCLAGHEISTVVNAGA